MRKQCTAAIKVKTVIELLKEEKTSSEMVSEYGDSTKQLTGWKNHAVAEMHRLFERQADKTHTRGGSAGVRAAGVAAGSV